MNSKETENSREPIIRDYKLKGKVGGSSLATVWKAVHRVTGEQVAVKQVFLSKINKHLRDCLDCELHFLSSVNHPNIIHLLDAFKAENFMFLVLEFCDGGDLASCVQHHGIVEEKIARSFLQQLATGLELLHSHHIIRRDLKPKNILLSREEGNLVLKIADFGLSR